jgi:muconolactone D-isomerase
MRFLLNIRTQLPGEWTAEERAEITRRQQDAAIDLMRRGVLRRTFRVVGQLADSLEELHAVLQFLSMFPFMAVTVTPIIKHPYEEAYESRFGALPSL